MSPHLALFLVWTVSAVVAGAALAWFAVRLRRGYSFSKLWGVYTGISAIIAGLLWVLWFA